MEEIIYIVYEEDRGIGIDLIAAFHSEKEANELAKISGHYFVQGVELLTGKE